MTKRMRPPAAVGLILVATLAAIGCGAGTASEATAETQAESGAHPSELTQRLQAQQRENEQRLEHQRELVRLRRSFVSVAFREIDAEGNVVVSITNGTSKDIDDIRGEFKVEDHEGRHLAGSSFTEELPHELFLPAGKTKEFRPYRFGRKRNLLEALHSAPDNVKFWFEALAITYADGSVEPELEG